MPLRNRHRVIAIVALGALLVQPVPAAVAAATLHEAENATISQGVVESNHAGFTGTGFVNYDNVAGSSVEWTTDSPQARQVRLVLRYANGTTADRPMSITLNGTTIAASLSFPGTGAWTTWRTVTLQTSLVAGPNTVKATATTANGGPNVDSLTVDDGTSSGTDWSKAVIDSTMARFTPSSLGGWGYTQGLYLWGQYLVWQRTGDARYLQYIKDWADRFVDSSGNISNSFGNLDSMQSGNVLLALYKETGQTRYRTAATKIRTRLNTYPRTSDGGWWHSTSDSRQGQLWGDGVYMVDPFLARYGAWVAADTFTRTEPAKQIEVYHSHLRRPSGTAAGLLYHAYDEPGGLTASWVKPSLGNTNGISWCRAMGWFGMATIDILDLLPADHPRRAALIDILRDLVPAYARWQDPATGRWFQVVTETSNSANWTETSCSAMYTYTISRAVELGYVDASYRVNADRGYQGVLDKVSLGQDGRTNIVDISEGTNASDSLSYYFNRGRPVNDFHGLGAFLIMNEQLMRVGPGN
ncbi:glycoside hydrolase family 88 protein [Nonomuraea sp. NEAU-A123]|uniref:glycoside hydrolase family 88 protein n=1 Tax=Nonomuraea sp. NEAU-A123 TaxID=2839649 RepID=UPI001BE3FFA1|nr:glycoside hydrolase family 88 protein [Nonomuraea sp. NEAU-A123]MBT2225649.1 glycoside hydrolase family 88 protein [Nonomuraea sp. NEAU-A123]